MNRSYVTHDNPVPVPPFWGTKTIDHTPARSLLPYINCTALYKLQWGYKTRGYTEQEYRHFIRYEVDPILARLTEQADREGIILPKAVYGYFPCQAEGDDLVIYTVPSGSDERCRFTFPRQTTERKRCISDFFRTVESGDMDLVAFQVATVGQHASDYARNLFAKDDYKEYLYWHGLNAESAEGLAEYIHKRIRVELGFGREEARTIPELIKQNYRGCRYSFGFPACPNLHDQDKILDLLDAQRIQVTLGDEDQLWPEESTSAIVVHHPEAKYFGV
ncbi:methionine synthase [mine drainage metagenome]|uniref:Methionine synthase n=1 Tax=mine drainage metagenome TaxID=410659 RepID=A0A1J5QHV1_9ZZZZ